mgnify:CR=1 FL=1
MRKKNGFTLVELLSTILILGVIFSISIYLVVKNINDAKNNTELITYNNIKSAAKVYNDEVASYWNVKDEYEYSCISLGNMIEIGYFDENIINKSDKFSKDTMLKVVRDKDSKVIKETSFSFEDSILPDVDCGYQSSVLIFVDNKGKKVKATNAKIIFNGLDGNYYRYFNLSGFSENTITTNDVVYVCEGIGNCSSNTVSNLESGRWYLASSDVVRLNIKSNGVISAFVNIDGENVADATKNIDFIDNAPPVINLSVYKIGSYEGKTPKTKGEFITTINDDYTVSEWKNYGYWFDISTNEDSVIKWTYNNEGSINGDSPSNSGANCNNSCSKTISGDGNRKATIVATDSAGNSSKIDVSIYIDRTGPTINVSEQRCSNKDNCLGSLIGNKIEKSTNTSISIDDKNWSYNSLYVKYNASDNMSNVKEIRILQNSSGIYDQLSTNMVSNNIVSNNSSLIISNTGQRYIQVIVYDNVGNSSIINITGYISNVITVNYNANGGSGAPTSQNKYNTVDLTLSSTKPTRTGYAFVSWNTSGDGSGISYQPESKYTANESTTLYAIWDANTYSISYNLNGGTKGSNAPISGKYGSTITISNPTRANYTFTGWTVSGTGASMNGTSLTIGLGNITLTANWKANDTTPPTCTLSIDASSGKIVADPKDDKGLAYYGWKADYSGDSSKTAAIAVGTHRYYVKDTSGNSDYCEIDITAVADVACETGYVLNDDKTSCYKTYEPNWKQEATGSCECVGTGDKVGGNLIWIRCSIGGWGNTFCGCPAGYIINGNYCGSPTWVAECSNGDTVKEVNDNKVCYSYKSLVQGCSDGYTQVNDKYCSKILR